MSYLVFTSGGNGAFEITAVDIIDPYVQFVAKYGKCESNNHNRVPCNNCARFPCSIALQ